MDRKLRNAYDKMTMPDDCAQRIERMLRERERPRGRQEERTFYRPRPRGRIWSSAAALVCVMVVVAISGVLALLHMGQWEEREILQPEQTSEMTARLCPLSEEGEAFLRAMCGVMPDWEGYFALNDGFWEEFLYGSFCDPEEGEKGMVRTLMGEVPCEDGTVLITREQAEDYASLTMACDLPLLGETEMQDRRLWYANGVFHIRRQETAESWTYVMESAGGHQGEIDSAHFGVYDQAGRKRGTVRFGLRPADNANGFVITSKHTDWEIREKPVTQVTGQDRDEDLLTGEQIFQQSVRETADYTARQYHLPWESFRLLTSQDCVITEEQDGFLADDLRHLEDGSWNQTEHRTLDLVRTEDGKEWKVGYVYGSYAGEKAHLLDTDLEKNGKFVIDYFIYKNPHENPWWVAYRWEETNSMAYEEKIVDGPWRLDPDTGVLTDLWGNVPEEARVSGIQAYFREILFFEDGCFLIPALNADREIKMLYVDPEAGQVTDLETLCGSKLDDYVASADTGEIYCWKNGRFWRIPRDTLRPEYLGKLQEDVVFASGVIGGQWATFSIERKEDGSYRVYDYVGDRFLTLEDFPNPDGVNWDRAEASPDGRKLLTSPNILLVQVLDCDTGKLLTLEREEKTWPSSSSGEIGWLESSEVYVRTTSRRNYVIYTLK